MTNKELANDISINIKKRMEQIDMTPAELSKLSNVHKSTLSHYLKGNRVPSIKDIVRIAYALKCKIGDLVMIFDVN